MTPSEAEIERLNRGLTKARGTLNLVVDLLTMNNDFTLKDKAHIRNGQVTVNLDVVLLSEAAKQAFASGKLRQNTYPGFKRIYQDALKEEGFASVSVYVYTNPWK